MEDLMEFYYDENAGHLDVKNGEVHHSGECKTPMEAVIKIMLFGKINPFFVREVFTHLPVGVTVTSEMIGDAVLKATTTLKELEE